LAGDRDGVLAFAIGQRRLDLLDQIRARIRRSAPPPSLRGRRRLVDEIDASAWSSGA